MAKVWMLELQLREEQELSIPGLKTILSAEIREEKLFVWAMYDPGGSARTIRFRLVRSGVDHPDVSSMDYLSTVQVRSGEPMFHVFCDPVPATGGDVEDE
jgi:hypothetical protein